mgnify:CR=1 FL=1
MLEASVSLAPAHALSMPLTAAVAPVVLEAVRWHAERGDAQTCAALTILLRRTALRGLLPQDEQASVLSEGPAAVWWL